MSLHLSRELAKLRRRALTLGGMVEEAIARSVSAMVRRDGAEARSVIEADAEIDRLEVEVEEECLKLLALYQPVAVDLRFIIAVLKIDNDLERMGDLAVNIAKSALRMATADPVEVPGGLQSMAGRTRSMVKRSLDAVVNADAKLAAEVCRDDDEVDLMRRSLREQVEGMISRSPDGTDALLSLFMAVGHLERLADMATNIAEDVIYMAEGKIVRHHGVSQRA